MKSTKPKLLIYAAIFISVITLLIFYTVAYKNLTNTLEQTKGEKAVLKMMYHLDQFQTAFADIESDVKPYLILKNKNKLNNYCEACNNAQSHIEELKKVCGEENIKCYEILALKNLFEKRIALADSILDLTIHNQPDKAVDLMNKDEENAGRTALLTKFATISNEGRAWLKYFGDKRTADSQNIYFLLGAISFCTFILLAFIFWRLLKQIAVNENLLSENKIFADIINNSSDAITLADTDWKLSFCNSATENLFKINKHEIIGKHVDKVFQTVSSEERLAERNAALKNKGHWLGELTRKDAEGNTINLHLTVNSVKDANGNTTGYFAIMANITALKKAQEAVEYMAIFLKKSNENLEERVKEQTVLIKEAFERVKDGFVATDADYNVIYANKTIDSFLGATAKDIYEENIFSLLKNITGKENREVLVESFAKQQKRLFNFLHLKTERWYQVNVYPSPNGLSLYLKDITISKKAEEEVYKSKRLYEFISKSNDLILHAKSADQIFSEICNIAINSAGFVFAWIAIVDNMSEKMLPIAWAGHEDGYLKLVREISFKDVPEGRGPAGKAFRDGKLYYCNDVENDETMSIWRAEALKRGYRSSIALPIKVGENVVGVFTVYAAKAFFFTDEEVQLVSRVTENISYALNTFNIDEQRKVAEAQLQKVSRAVEQSTASVVITDLRGCIEYVNPAFSKLTGYSYEEAIGQNPRILKTGYTNESEYNHLWQNITHKEAWQGVFCNKKKSGETYWEYAIISPIVNCDGVITNYVAVKENITERKRLEEEQKQLLKIFENTTAYVATADMQRNFIYANKAIRDVLEVGDDEDITQLNVNDFRTAFGEETIAKANEMMMQTGKWIGENSYKTRSGKVIPVLQVIVLHKNDNGTPTHISTTAIDISKIKEAEKEMLRMNKELRDFSSHLQNISEIEKKEIAREIHDELGQDLTALRFGVSWVKKHLDGDRDILNKKIEGLLNDITETMASFRRIHSSLHPAMLEEVGLYAAVEWLVKSFSKSYGIAISFSSNVEKETINFYQSLALYRVVQESLTNVMRYANAANVTVAITRVADDIVLHIADDGNGFDVDAVDTTLHHGILGMRERVYAMNGTFSIHSVMGDGTFINVHVPIIT